MAPRAPSPDDALVASVDARRPVAKVEVDPEAEAQASKKKTDALK